MFEWLRDLMVGSPTYTAHVTGEGFLTSVNAQYERGKDGAQIDMNFSEPVRDGNNINHMNIRDPETGTIVGDYDLRTGETGLDLNSEIDYSIEYDLVFVDQDGNAVSEQNVVIERH
ncbi:hypothetical protein GCM10008995_29160 [Halobellus salinus]|uniref:Uncharacterized protein n=1 Tax=Halobellus salinus TaxID=931585 RepID=A0A830EED6_9EURY|nr:hypothetical protein [Halobellus salinus]GGJ17564.1 hypothetical protein GCM10008995_29160 [Halobellus salinus]SMP35508.1 hypothetical protein SAMN06265347_1315 [Halobellus salinus]